MKAVKRVKWSTGTTSQLKLAKIDTMRSSSVINTDEYVEIDELGDGELFGDFALLNE